MLPGRANKRTVHQPRPLSCSLKNGRLDALSAAFAIVLGAVWQTYRDNQTRNLVKASAYRVTSSFGATKRGSISSAQSPLSDQAPQTPTAPSVSADEVTGLKQQLQALVNELAVMRRDVEQLSSKHEQLSRDIAAVQTTEQNVSEKVSSLTQPAASLTQSAPARSPILYTPGRGDAAPLSYRSRHVI